VVAYRQFLREHPDHKYVDWANKQLEKLAEAPAEQ
jgi:hypothetical protein